MLTRRGSLRLAGAFLATVFATAPLFAASKPPIAVAVTFDDLPAHAALPPGVSRMDIANSVIATLKAHHAPPVYGFVNATWLEKEPATGEVLHAWVTSGNLLGNHTFTHMDPNQNPASAFEQDLLADEPTLKKYMGPKDWHWLRLPYLNEGDTPEKRAEIAAFAQAHGYRLAQVTLGFDDWAYNDTYARCATKGDTAAVAWMKENMLSRAGADLKLAQTKSQLIYGRNVNNVLLMHIGAFSALMLPQILELYEKNGVKLVTLPQAESDPAYVDGAIQHFAWGGSMLDEEAALKNITVPREADHDQVMAKLASLCK